MSPADLLTANLGITMTRSHLRTALAALILTALAIPNASGQDPQPSAEAVRFFEAHIRPVLVDQCFKCHGPEKQKAGLRLDSRSAMLGGGDTGPAIVPGHPEESVLVAALRYEEDGPQMPPSKRLPKEQIDTFSRWVEMGAPWPGGDTAAAPSATRKPGYAITDQDRGHWAFRPVTRPEVPSVQDREWAASPIDRFVLAKLEAKGLKPNPPATKAEFLRRATYDLTGLPPTPAEAERFLADTSPNAYDALIDRLLASPRYGEKWGRHWLDLVRFAETNSYERDGAKPNAWRYRDYVIRSLNADKPYDRFIREQLAGDELPDRDIESIIATGYYRLGIWDDEPSDREQARFDSLDDLVATTGQVFLGLTVDCARCHDHKLDPIPQKDYYRLLAFFRNINPYRNGGPTDEYPIVTPGTERALAERARELESRRKAAQDTIAGLEEEFRKRYVPPSGETVRSTDLDELRYRFYRDTWDRLPDFAAIKYEDEGDLPVGLFDLAPRTRDVAFGFVFEGTLIVARDGVYTFRLDSDDGSRLSVGGRVVVENDGLHELGRERSGDVELAKGRVPIRLEYFQKGDGLGLNVAWSGPGFAKRSLSASKRGAKAIDVRSLIRSEGERVLGTERMERYRRARQLLAETKDRKVIGDAALCVTESSPAAPETFVLLRGSAHSPGDKVEPGFLEVLSSPAPTIPPPSADARTTGRRRVLADWIASPENPLTARVVANRVFQHHFDRGIVRSPNNFGTQGDTPTHPELLDWLASEFLAQGWRLKPLHRAIMSSNTYRMSSRADPEALAKDPGNELLWRVDMRRLTAEEIRDSILAVTGTLNLKMFGPGVYPEIPKEVMAGQSVPGAGWGKSPPEEQARRSIYIHVKRSLLTPILEGFDLAETDRPSPVRFSSTQPTQALAMLNGAFLNGQADALADRLRREAGDVASAQVRLALRLVTGRDPSVAEVRRGMDLVESLSKRDSIGPGGARKAFCLVALNLNEFLYVD